MFVTPREIPNEDAASALKYYRHDTEIRQTMMMAGK
jgi:hypothetical protein